MNEAEPHLLQQRMYQGKLNMARRGEPPGTPPVGYLRAATGEWVGPGGVWRPPGSRVLPL